MGGWGVLKLLPFNSRRNELSFDMSHAIFLKNEKMTKWAFFGIKNVKNGKIHFLFNPRRNTILFDMSHAIFLKNEKNDKIGVFCIKKSKMSKITF